ncbi:MAG: TerB family tellurite resistance protein [Bacteroidetes bacterium]|nr:TerB family tellurite resistance protein [Bacteroidota bacterium]
MEITQLDKSNYLKGLLIVAKKDKQITEQEKKILKSIADKLGFAKDFYEDTIRDLLANKYIIETPIKFSEKKIAESFISDGLKLAYADDIVSDIEISWLRITALENDLNDDWFENRIKKIKESSTNQTNSEFALLSII